MSIEKGTRRPVPERPVEEGDVDRLLQFFPEENQERLEKRLEGLSLAEQVSYLKEALRKRHELTNYTSNRLPVASNISQRALERLQEETGQIPVGKGDNGRVFELSPADEEAGVTAVFKALIRPPLAYHNDLLTEGSYQADIAAFADERSDLCIGVPHPYYIAASDKGYVLAMEKVPGFSIDKILEQNLKLPPECDLDRIEAHLQEFVEAMNDAGFYHRDLREGNIMIDPYATESHLAAYIIDFGVAIKAQNRQKAYERLDGLQDHVMVKKVMERLRAQQARV